MWLRVLDWPAPGLYQNDRGPLALRAPGRAGGVYPPGAARLRHYDYDVSSVANSHGFREREWRRKAPGEWRIGVLGNSMTAGVGVEPSERFSEVWSNGSFSRVNGVTLWNLGTPFCGTACAAEILDGIGRKYELDEIVLAFFGGQDLEFNLQWYQNGGKTEVQVSTSLFSERVRRWLREHCRLVTFVWINALRRFVVSQPPGTYSVAAFRQSWSVTEQALARLKEGINSRRFTIIYLPSTPEWDDNIWRATRHKHNLPEDGRFMVKQALRQWARGNATEFIDATPWLLSCPSAKECTFPVDGHWNARGHRLVGEGMMNHWKVHGRVTQ